MGYFLPMGLMKVSNKQSSGKDFDVAIQNTRIVAIMSTEIYQARQTIAAERKAGTLINAAGTSKAKSAILLDNGQIVASPLSVGRLITAYEKSMQKLNPNMNKQIRVLDIVDDETYCDEDDE